MSSFFKSIEESKPDAPSAEKDYPTKGRKRKLDEETNNITFNNNNVIDNVEVVNSDSSGDDNYYQWKRKRRKVDDDTRQQSVKITNEEVPQVMFEINPDITLDTANDTLQPTVMEPVERKRSPMRSEGVAGGERSIRRIDFAAVRKEKEARVVKPQITDDRPSPRSLRSSGSTSIKGSDTEPVLQASEVVREFKRPGIARSGSGVGMTRVVSGVNRPPAKKPPPNSSPKKKKQLQTLTTDNFFDTTPAVFVPKKATTNEAPRKNEAPKRPAAPPKKSSGNVLDSILNSMQQ